MTTAVVATLAAGAAGAAIWLGRRDLSHPAVAFASVWFFFVAVAQLRLTPFEYEWSASFAVVVFAGGLTFVAAAVAAAGTAPVRGSIAFVRSSYRPRRLAAAGAVLMAGAVVGLAWKATVFKGIPLFSGEIDVQRFRAYGRGTGVPAWSTFLTDGFRLGLFCFAVALWLDRRVSWSRRAIFALAIAFALVGAAAEGSRNTLGLAIVPLLVAAYVYRGRLSRRTTAVLAISVVVVTAVMSGLVLLRTSQQVHSGTSFTEREQEALPLPAEPLFPLYMSGVFPLELERRVVAAFPESFSYGHGEFELDGLPDFLFPEGKTSYGGVLGNLTTDVGEEPAPYWVVASYQGRAFADFGAIGVVLVSALLGLLFGLAYRACRGSSRLLALAIVGYVAYFSALLVYENLLAVAVMAVGYDVLVLALVDRWSRAR